jgi:hypothetical protein
VEQAGVEYTWEWFLIDPSQPWASAVPPLVRERIEADLDRRSNNAVANANARAQEAERLAEEKDDEVIAAITTNRVTEGKEPYTEEQEASVRETRRRRRTKQS